MARSMTKIADDITQLIGGTPLVRVRRLAEPGGAEVVTLDKFRKR